VIAVPLPTALLLLAGGSASFELLVRTPLDGRDVESLRRCFADHADAWGVQVRIARIVEVETRDLVADTLLLGYEEGVVAEWEHEGELAGGDAAARAFAREAWAPVWRRAVDPGDPPPPSLESLLAFVDAGEERHLVLRRLAPGSCEALLLGAVGLTLGWNDDDALGHLVIAGDARETLRPGTMSHAQLLRELAPGCGTLAPVRTAVAMQRSGAPIDWGPFQEGFPTLVLSAAVTRRSGEAARAWFATRFAAEIAPALRAALDLEPLDAPAADAPSWQRTVEPARLRFDHSAADALGHRIAELAGELPQGPPESGMDLFERLIEGLLLTGAVAAIWYVALRVGRARRRDPDGGAVV
jgi:hypothetical protein